MVCGFLLLGEALEFCGVCCLYSLYLSPINVRLWSRHKNRTPGRSWKPFSGGMASEGVSQQSWWSLLVSMTNRLCAPQHLSSGTWIVFSNLLYSTLLIILKQNDKSLQILLETYMGTLGIKTLLSQSQWNFWRSLKSSINYSFLKSFQNCKVSPKEKAVWVRTWNNTETVQHMGMYLSL